MPLHSRFLSYFSGVCQYGSIRKAAKQLHISPTAINRAIINFEDEINLKLFERTNDGMTLTQAGHLLYSHVNQTMIDARITLNLLKELSEGENSQIKVGGAESIISSYLPSVMHDFFKLNSKASTSFTLCTTEQAVSQLESSKIDVAVIFDPAANSRVKVIYEQRLTIGAVLLPDHPLARQDHLQIEQTMDYPLILPDRSWPLRKRLDHLFETLSLPVNMVMECGSTEILQSMISSKIGIGFHTIVGIEHNIDAGHLIFLPLLAPEREYQKLAICIQPNKRVTPVLRSMLDLLTVDIKSYHGR